MTWFWCVLRTLASLSITDLHTVIKTWQRMSFVCYRDTLNLMFLCERLQLFSDGFIIVPAVWGGEVMKDSSVCHRWSAQFLRNARTHFPPNCPFITGMKTQVRKVQHSAFIKRHWTFGSFLELVLYSEPPQETHNHHRETQNYCKKTQNQTGVAVFQSFHSTNMQKTPPCFLQFYKS